MRRRSRFTTTATASPSRMPPPAAMRKSREIEPTATAPVMAAIAVRRLTRAVASLSRDSPSSTVTIWRGSPMRRATALAETASGGATAAPRASATGQGMSGTRACSVHPTVNVVTTTAVTDSRITEVRFALMSMIKVCSAEEYSSGGSSPTSTSSGPSSIIGTKGRNEPITPRTMRTVGAGSRSRSLREVPARTVTTMPTSSRAVCMATC